MQDGRRDFTHGVVSPAAAWFGFDTKRHSTESFLEMKLLHDFSNVTSEDHDV